MNYPTYDHIDHIAGQPLGAYIAIAHERNKQDRKWGPQNHPILPERVIHMHRARHNVKADAWKRRNDARVQLGDIAWDGILLEEVHEAFAEADPAKIREEMVQVAAVAVAIIEYLDREAAK